MPMSFCFMVGSGERVKPLSPKNGEHEICPHSINAL